MVSHNTVFKLTEIKLIYYLSHKTSRVQILKIKKKSGPVRFKNFKRTNSTAQFKKHTGLIIIIIIIILKKEKKIKAKKGCGNFTTSWLIGRL
jgi:hypothetical protein